MSLIRTSRYAWQTLISCNPWGLGLQLVYCICLVLLFGLCAVSTSHAQSNEAETRVTAIDMIGRDLVILLNQLIEGERDPTKRLPLIPVLDKANMAVKRSPIFLQAQANVREVTGQRNEALAALFPRVSGSIGSGSANNSSITGSYAGKASQQSLSVSQLLYDFGASWSGLTAAEKRQASSLLRIESQRSELTLQVIKVFYETQRALLQVRLARENLQARRSFVNFIRERADLGASSSADVVRAESRVAEALEILASSLQALSQAQANYRQYYDAEAEPYILPKEISTENIDLNQLDVYVRGHPATLAAELDLAAANADVEAAKARLIGGIYAEVSRSKSQGPGALLFSENYSSNVVVRGEIYSGGAQSARLEQSLAKREKSAMELDRIRQEQLRVLREAFAEYNGQLASVSARMLVFKGAEDSYAISKDLYAFSRSSLFEVLKSQEDLYNAGQRLIDSIINRAMAKYKLLHAAQRLNQEVAPKS